MSNMQKTRKNVLLMVQLSILIAIEAVVCFTPLGSLPIGPMVATLSHIPVIIAAILLGVKGGALLGFSFGLFSFLVWTFMPPNPVLAFVWTPAYAVPGSSSGSVWSLILCFLPRILLGIVVALLVRGFKKFNKNGFIAYPLAAILGSLLHTVLVLGGIWFTKKEINAAQHQNCMKK